MQRNEKAAQQNNSHTTLKPVGRSLSKKKNIFLSLKQHFRKQA